MDTIKNIAFFPLNTCLFPGEDIPLKIFEPRYKQLINDCESEKFTFGIPFVLHNKMSDLGTEVQLNQVVAKNSHGEMVIMVEGIANFELKSFRDKYKEKMYAGGTIKRINPDCYIQDNDLITLINKYSIYFDNKHLKDICDSESYFCNDVAKSLNLSSEDKYKYLSIDDNSGKENFLRSQLEYVLLLKTQENLLRNDFSLN